jgi:nucleoside-diphosphate-sugar epimerase
MNSNNVVQGDISYIIDSLKVELSALSGHRLLLTGGGGFLGYYIVSTIVEWNKRSQDTNSESIDLLIYDNFIRGLPQWLSDFVADGCLTVKKHNVTDPIPADIGDVAYIVHAASIASPIYYRKYPVETMDANVNGLRYLLDFFKERQERSEFLGGLLYFSTSEIYGDPDPTNIPTSEDYRGNVSCTGPRACYDESKRYGETLCVNFAKQFNLPIKIARPFNNYGPGLKISDRRALPDFALNVLNGEDVILLSDGSPTRTFCYVADAIIGYFKILVRGQNGESYNIGVDKPEISIRELAERTVQMSHKLFDYKGKAVFGVSDDKHYLTDNPNRRCPAITKAQHHLEYNPKIGLEEGLKRSLLWYAENREAEDV